VLHSTITDNDRNFTSKELKDYCEGLGIKLNFPSVAHPLTNEQVKKANSLICNDIKKRLLAPLKTAKHAWVDELPSVLWSLRTTPNSATQKTPFFCLGCGWLAVHGDLPAGVAAQELDPAFSFSFFS
jgi:hypothetical protein